MVQAADYGGGPSGIARQAQGKRVGGQSRRGAGSTGRGRRLAAGVCVVVVTVLAAALWPALPARAHHTPYCYVVGDSANGTQRILSRVTKSDPDPATNEVTVGVLGTLKTDGIGMHPTTGVLYGMNSNMSTRVGVFGTISLSTGAFSAIGNGITQPNSNDRANGSLGLQDLYDASGFAFDTATGKLYATHVRTGSDTAVDLLYQVNVGTGRFIADAFGAGQDYVVLPKLAAFPQFHDVDDIAIDPGTGQMYGVMNNSTSGDRLIKIDKATGATTDVGGFGVDEVEGLDFDPHGQLWATADGTAGVEANKLYAVDKSTGAASGPRPLDNGGDYEGLACMTASPATPPPPDPALSERVYLPSVSR